MRAHSKDKDKSVLHIGMFGFGVVGTAVYQLLGQQAAHLAREVGAALTVRRVVVRNLHKPRPVPVPPGLLTTDPDAILADPEIDLVVEVMGGLHPTLEYVRRALTAGKSVITANKELVAEHGPELLALAREHGADLYFEASVGGAIPILRPLRETLSAGELRQVVGIVNGTTNYILDRMTRDGQTFAEALAQAQALGYAEADPTADVEGLDPARKIAILASIAFRTHVKSSSVACTGITGVTPADIAYGAGRGWVIKLLAFARRDGDEVEARVEPCFLPSHHPLAGVGDAFNAIYVRGDEIGEAMFYGRGAGGLPTGSAILGDILAAARNRRLGVSLTGPWPCRPLRVRPAGGSVGRWYLRLHVVEPALAAVPVGAGAVAGGGAAPAADLPAAGAQVLVERLSRLGVPVERAGWLSGGQLAVETGPVTEATLHTVARELAGVAVPGIAIRILD